MTPITIDCLLDLIRTRLDLSSQTERELLEEIRTHLEDAVAAAQARGEDGETALRQTAENFGVEEVGDALQQLHAPWESADAIIACALPVLAALILRWLIFAPDGSALGWPELLARPAFWIVTVVAWLVPLLQFRQWRYALVSWSLFWAISILFVVFPARHW